MKLKNIIKISFLTILITTFFVGPVKNNAHAQSQMFNLTNVEKSATLGNPNKDQFIILPPFTIVTVPAGAFTDKVYVYVYKGNFDAIKSAILPNLSPISSYYLVFGDNNSHKVYPKAPIKIQSLNNFANTDTYLYSLNSPDKIGSSPQKFNGQVKVNQDLPLGNYGFIVAASIDIQKDNAALIAKPVAKKAVSNPSLTITQAPKPNTSNSNLGNIFSGLLPIVLALIVVIVLIVIVLIAKKRKNTNLT